mgnify:CR=1 FL=1
MGRDPDFGMDGAEPPEDDNDKVLRRALWLELDQAYKNAVEDLARKKALSNVPKADFALYNKVSGDSLLKNANLFMGEMGNKRRPKGPGKDWELDTALAYLKDGLGANRDYENGKAMFAAMRAAIG